MELKNIHQVYGSLCRTNVILVPSIEQRAATFTLIFPVARINIPHSDCSFHIPMLAQGEGIPVSNAATGIPAHITIAFQRREQAERQADSLRPYTTCNEVCLPVCNSAPILGVVVAS